MLREEFTVKFTKLMESEIPRWLPEEAPEEMMLDTMFKEIINHEKLIREFLLENVTNEN